MSAINKVLDFLIVLSNTSSSNEKKKMLKANKDNETLIEIFKFLFDKNFVTGISSKKMNSDKRVIVKEDFDSIIEVFGYLKDNNSGRITDISVIWKFINKIDKVYEKTLIELFSKKLRLGITATTLNSVYGNDFIDVHEVQLALVYEDEKDYLKGKIIGISTKLDGNRCEAIVRNNKCTLKSREGKLITGFNDIEEELSKLDDCNLDGELKAISGDSSIDQFRNTQKSIRKKTDNKKGIAFNVFDFINGETFENRRKSLDQIFKDNDFEHIVKVELLYIGPFSEEIVDKYFNEAIENKEEGIMINTMDGLYKRSKNRTKDLLKRKSFKDIDLQVVSLVEGEGDLVGMLGSVVVKYKGFEVNVGSGFSDSQRKEFWDDNELILRKIIRIKYQDESSNEKGELSLRIPIFVDVLDKEVESYF